MLRTIRHVIAGTGAAGFAWIAYLYLTLPDVRPLIHDNPRTTAFMEMRAREALASGQTPAWQQWWVAYDRISPQLRRAVVLAEDATFWQHDGIDLVQIREAIAIDLERREFYRGGSTITQQLAKNLYLSPARNPIRKLRELFIARRLEAELGKPRILEIYLNVIEWGRNIFGAEAAARAYFKKPAIALGPAEAALLAGAIINPRLYNPAEPGTRLQRRQQIILDRMGAADPGR
jgi:monofunctional biosynthetic peptidoglycan transglycosylase